MRKFLLFLSIGILLPVIHLYAAPPSRSYDYTTGAIINATEVTTNENNIYRYLQTGVDTLATNTVETTDIQAGAVTSEKIYDGTIVNADVSSSAAIADTKLATITTAGKVNATAIVGVDSLPAGAGVIPVANLGSGTGAASNYLRGDGAWTVIPTPVVPPEWKATNAASLDLANQGDVDWTTLDLTSVTSTTASVVILHTTISQANAGQYGRAYFRKAGTAPTYPVQLSVSDKDATAVLPNTGTILVGCSSGQEIEYSIDASGANGVGLLVAVEGYW